MRDLKAIGAHNVTAGRPPGMTARAVLAAVERNYERFRRAGRLPATFEVVYGHAWLPQPRTTRDGKPVIEIKARGAVSDDGYHSQHPRAATSSPARIPASARRWSRARFCMRSRARPPRRRNEAGRCGRRAAAEGLINEDVERLRAAGNVAAASALINPYCFEPAIAPHIAAAQAGITIESRARRSCIRVALRGRRSSRRRRRGWILRPLNRHETTADVAGCSVCRWCWWWACGWAA